MIERGFKCYSAIYDERCYSTMLVRRLDDKLFARLHSLLEAIYVQIPSSLLP